MVHIERLRAHPDNKTKQNMQRDGEQAADQIEALLKDAERWRVLRDRCMWMTFIAPGLVRVAFRIPGEWTRVIETGNDLDDLVDATLAPTSG